MSADRSISDKASASLQALQAVPLSPQDQARVLNALLHNLGNTPGLGNIRGGAAFARELLLRMKAQAAAPVVFRYRGEDAAGRAVYDVGRGDEVRTVTTGKRGVFTVWWLLANPGQAWDPAMLSRPDARTPADSARTMVRVGAARQFEAWGMPELVAAANACRKRGQHMHMERPHNAPPVVTR